MPDVVEAKLRALLPAGRKADAAEAREVLDYVEFVLDLVQKNMPRVNPKFVGDWYYTLVGALNVTIALREGDLSAGPVFDKYCWYAKTMRMAYADHYLQMRADAFNMGPNAERTLRDSVYDYDIIKQLHIAPKTGSAEVTPATALSIFWGLQGIADGLNDDLRYPRKTKEARHPESVTYDELCMGLQKAGILVFTPGTWIDRVKQLFGSDERPGQSSGR